MPSPDSWNTPWDDDDAAPSEDSFLDAFDAYLPAPEGEDAQASLDPLLPHESEDRDAPLTLLFTAKNPADTVSVTAMMGGQIVHVELSPQVTKMTETELAKEITVIANLARRQALAAVHVIVADLLRQQGQDRFATSSALEHEFGLPSPDTVRAEHARLYAAPHPGDHD